MKKFICTIALAALVSSSAMAQEANRDVYPSLSDIPAPLRQVVNSSVQFPEQYIDRVLAIIRQTARDKRTLSKEDVDIQKQTREDEQRRMQVQQIMVYDRNFDGKVTRDEIIATLSERYHGQVNAQILDQQINSIMQADTNGDGVVTMQEMADSAAKKTNRYSRSYYGYGQSSPEDFLAMDPNGDGVLTVSELESLARKAFRTMDSDGDGMLSQDELAAVQKISSMERQMGQVSSDCKLPAPLKNEEIVFIGAYEGKTLSNISVAGQMQKTGVIPLDIAEGSKNLYIIAAAFTPTIWQITGKAKRVSHLVLSGPTQVENPYTPDSRYKDDGKVNAGETGISADKVVFRSLRDCGLLTAYESRPEMQDYTKFSLSKLLGRMPDFFTGEHDASTLHVFDDHISNDLVNDNNTVQTKAPEGFDHDAWIMHLRYMPGGFVDLEWSTPIFESGFIVTA